MSRSSITIWNSAAGATAATTLLVLLQSCIATSEWPMFSSRAKLTNVRLRHEERPLFGRLFIPPFRRSQSIAPAALLLPGVPGADSWEDLAYKLRDSGLFCLLLLHSGAQGAAGDFSYAGALADAMEGYNWLTNLSSVDTQRIAVIGNELGCTLAIKVMEEARRLQGVNKSDYRTIALINPVLVESEDASLSERMDEAKAWIGLSGDGLEKEWKQIAGEGTLRFSCAVQNMTLRKKRISPGGDGEKTKQEGKSRGLIMLTSNERPNFIRRIFPRPMKRRREFYRNLQSIEEFSGVHFAVRRYFMGHSTRQKLLQSIEGFICDALSHDSFNYGESKISRFIKTPKQFQIAACLYMAVGYLAWAVGSLTAHKGPVKPTPTFLDPSITQ